MYIYTYIHTERDTRGCKRRGFASNQDKSWFIEVSVEKTLLLHEPSPCRTAAGTPLHP